MSEFRRDTSNDEAPVGEGGESRKDTGSPRSSAKGVATDSEWRGRSGFANRAEELFAQWLGEAESGAAGSFEELVRANTAFESELRQLESSWREVERVFAALTANSRAFQSALESLGGAPTIGDHAATQVLERLGSLRPGRERYELRRVIDSGGMGVVLEVRDAAFDRSQAMKVLRTPDPRGDAAQAARSRNFMRRFLAEAAVLARLEHPSIVPVHDFGVDGAGRPFFTMPHVRGVQLLQVIDRFRVGDPAWPQSRLIEVLLKVCDALAFAHDQGVVHRDIKPENVMVGAFGEVYVMDWGLARVREERDGSPSDGEELRASAGPTLFGDVLGTPAYMAPEQADPQRSIDIDPRVDVYAVGAVLYHALCGHAPHFHAGRPASGRELLDRVRAGPPPDLAQLAPTAPTELVAIQRRAMERDRDLRYASVEALAADLRAYAEGRVVRAHEQGAWAELKKWIGRNRALSLATATALLVAAAAAVLVITSERDRADDALARGDANGLTSLAAEFDELWPATPANAPRMERWIRECRAILGRVDGYRAGLAGLEQRALPLAADDARENEARRRIEDELDRLEERVRGCRRDIEDMLANATGLGREQGLHWMRSRMGAAQREIARLQAALERPSVWNFDDANAADRHESFRTAAELSSRFTDPDDGLLRAMEERDARARTLRERSIDSYAREWSEAVRSIADVRASPIYDGLRIEPQLGLAPLGPDPHSGLWEFAHIESGEVPLRGLDGRLAIDERSAIVLVLLPPGRVQLAKYFPPERAGHARPVAELDAFFIGKHEVTQAQWIRATGDNPSYFHPGSDWPRNKHPEGTVTLANPVEQISWHAADTALRRMELALPTEAQWEYAYRANTTTYFYAGDDACSIHGLVNASSNNDPELQPDGWDLPAPIGTFPPNPWGLHEIAGNVAEWTRDWFWVELPQQLAPSDGAVPTGESRLKSARGGNFWSTANGVMAAERMDQNPDASYRALGVRAARRVER